MSKSALKNAPSRKAATSSAAATVDKYARCKRHGKTRKDAARGQSTTNAANKEARASWQQKCRSPGGAGSESNNTFPHSTCNGKRNRFVRTGKGGNKVVGLYRNRLGNVRSKIK